MAIIWREFIPHNYFRVLAAQLLVTAIDVAADSMCDICFESLDQGGDRHI